MNPKPEARPADTTREKLLAAALEQFGEHGYAGASIREIARATGANVALVSYHFGGKEQLYRELLRHVVEGRMQNALAQVNTSALPAPSPDEARAMLKALFRRFIENTLGRDDILLAARLIIREQTRPTAGFDVVFNSGMETLHKTVTRLLAIASGRKPGTRDSIIRAHMLLGQIFSFVFANATICRRLGKTTLDKQTLSAISTLIGRNIDALATPSLP